MGPAPSHVCVLDAHAAIGHSDDLARYASQRGGDPSKLVVRGTGERRPGLELRREVSLQYVSECLMEIWDRCVAGCIHSCAGWINYDLHGKWPA